MNEELKVELDKMKAENKQALADGNPIVHDDAAFEAVVKNYEVAETNSLKIVGNPEADFKKEHEINRQKFKNQLLKKGLQEVDVLRNLQIFDDEEFLKWEQNQKKLATYVPKVDIVEGDKKSISRYLKPEEFNEHKQSDDPRLNTSNYINSKISSKGFKAISINNATAVSNEGYGGLGSYVKITAANGNNKIFNVKQTGTSTSPSLRENVGTTYANENTLEEIIAWTDSQEISSEQNYIFQLTNETQDENGFYNLNIINDSDINPTYDYERQISISGYQANIEQTEVIVSLVHSSIKKAITNPESMGLQALYSTVRSEEISVDDKEEIRNAVYNRVNKKLDITLSKDSFGKIFEMYDGILYNIKTENSNYNNLKASGEKLDPNFKNERIQKFYQSLSAREKIKFDLYKQIRDREEVLRIAGTPYKDDEKLNDLKNSVKENSKTKIPVGGLNSILASNYLDQEPPSVVVENPELSSMLFENDMLPQAVEEAAEIASEFDKMTDLELAKLAYTLPPTMSDREVIEHYRDNLLKIRLKTEKEFLDKKITINITNLGAEFNVNGFFRKYPEAKEKNKMWTGGSGTMTISIQELYNAGFNSHKIDAWASWGKEISDEDLALYQDYEAFRLKSVAQETSINKMLYLNLEPSAIKRNISFVGSLFNGLYEAGKHTFGVPTLESDDLTGRQTITSMQEAVQSVNEYINTIGGQMVINGETINVKQIKWGDKEMDAFTQAWNERLGETIGGFIPMAVELSLLSAATGGVLTWTGAARMISNLRKSKSTWDKMMGMSMNIGIEEFKLHGLMGFNLGDGTTFSILGDATKNVGNLKFLGAFSQLYQKTIKQGMVGATSLDVAQVTAYYIKDLQNNADFNAEIEKYFGDSSENVKRWLYHAAAFSFTGLHNIKKGDLLGEAGKYNAIRDLEREMSNLYTVVNVDGVNVRIFGGKDAKGKIVSAEQAEAIYNAKLGHVLTLKQMIKEHENLISHDPAKNPKWKEQMEISFNRESDFQQKLKKENPNYEGFDIKFSENSADFYSETNAAQYNYAGSMFGGVKQSKPFILINPKLYKVGKMQHEALIHATVDAYFSQGGKQRKEVFIKNVSEKFKDIDFSVFPKEGTREYKLAEYIKEYYSGSGSVKSEEFLGYMVEFLTKPEVYYEKVAQDGIASLTVDIKTMLRENFNMFTDVKSKDAMELIAVVARGLEGGKFNEKSFDLFMGLLSKPASEGGLDIISPNTKTTTNVTPRESKSVELIGLQNKKTEILENLSALYKKSKEGPEIEALKKELVDINKELSSSKYNSITSPGNLPMDFSLSNSNEKILEQNTSIEKQLKESSYQEISTNPDPRKIGRGLSFTEINSRTKAINNSIETLVRTYLKDGKWSNESKKKEFEKLTKDLKGLEQLNSLKFDLISNNQKGIDKIINDLYKKGSNVDKEIRVPFADFKAGMMREFEQLIDSYQFKVMKDGKFIDNPVPFMAYATPNFKLREGKAYEFANKGKLKGESTIDITTLDQKLTLEDGLGGGGSSGTPASVETLITVKNDFIVNGQKFITEKMEKEMEVSFEGFDFTNASYKSLKNPIDISFGKKIEDKVQAIGENALLILKSLPQNVSPITGKATGVPNSLLKYFYEKGERVKSKETGSTAGNPIQNKLELTPEQFLEKLGITSVMKDGKIQYVINKSSKDFRNVKTAINNLELQVGKIVYNQAAREYLMKNPDAFPVLARNTTIETIIHEIASGKDQSMASKDFADKLIEDGTIKDYNEYRALSNTYSMLGPLGFESIYGADLAGKFGMEFIRFAEMELKKGIPNKENPITQGVSTHINKQAYSKNGMSSKSTSNFKLSEKDQKNFMDQSSVIMSEIFLGEGVNLAHTRLMEGLFTSHYSTTGPNNIVTNSFISNGRKSLITRPTNSRFDKSLLKELESIDYSSFKSPYDTKNYNAYERIRNATTLQEKLDIAKETFTDKSLETSRKIYDVWNRVLEQYVHRNKDGSKTEKYLNGKLNPEWSRKMDYVALLKKNNATIGIQGERLLAPEGYVFIPQGKYVKGKENPDYPAYYKAQLERITSENNELKDGNKKKLSKEQIIEKAERLALKETGDKVEHFQSSNERGISSLMLIENNQFHKRGTENMDNYVGIFGQIGAFNLIDKSGGQINTAGIFRFAYNIDLAKSTYSIESIKSGKPKTIYQEMLEQQGAASIKEIELAVKEQNNKNIEILKENGIEVSLNPFENIIRIQELNNSAAVELSAASKNVNLSTEFNNMMEGNFNIKSEATFSKARADIFSKRRKWYESFKELFVGSNADDFKGLTNYRLVNQKGKKGEQQQKFYDDALHIPYAMGVNALNVAKSKIQTEYKDLNKRYPNVKKILEKDIPADVFSNSNAVRVYLWTKKGIDMTEFGLAGKDIKKMLDAVENNPELLNYSKELELIVGKKGYVEPDAFWLTQGIQQDLAGITMGPGRSHYIKEFIDNKNQIFSEVNLNKIEAIHGKEYRQNLENMLHRMEKGTNRVFSKEDKLMNNLSDWTNGSVGVTMFLNTRSAVLQTLSATNYINFGANNPINAARAFANQPQYWKDFSMIFNSPMLKQRRGGLQTDVNHTELAAMSKKGGAKGAIGYLLTKGFLPTQLADSFAIAAGGSTFYRNTFNRKIKEGLSVKEAESQTWLEFTQKTQETQQSSDPSKISAIQSSGIGRLVFAFQNTPLQYTREIKKSALDLAYNRGDIKTNISKIIYYGAAQNLIFGALQNALFTVAFDDDESKFDTKTQRTLNGMFDTVLRGSGLPGAILATTKNTLMKFLEEEKKGFNADHAQTLIQAANFAPPVGIKARKLYSSMKGWQLNKNVIPHMGLSINNPAYQIAGSFTAAATNFPLDRIVQKTNNVREILTGDHAWWQNVSLAAGYRPWDVGIVDSEKTEAITLVKEEKKIEKAKKKEKKKQEKKEEEKKEKEELQKEQKKKGEELTCLECNRKVIPGKKVCTVHEKKEQTKDGKEKQCSKIKKDKTRCKMMTANKSGKCYYHD